MRDKLMMDVTTLQELVERIEQQRNEVEISVASQAQALGRVTQSALEHSDHINAALKIQASDLNNVSDQAAEQAKSLGLLFQQYSGDLQEAIVDALQQAADAEKHLLGSAEELRTVALQVGNNATQITSELHEQIGQMTENLEILWRNNLMLLAL